MKIKSKLILAATSLLVLSGVAAGTSTYAWYTANRQVELEVTNISAIAQLSTLTMKYEYSENTRNGSDENGTDGIDPFSIDESPADSAIVGTFSKTLTDVSSKGDNSYLKPIFDATGENSVGFWTNEENYTQSPNADNDVFYHRMVFTFTISGTEDVALYLSPNSYVTENTTGALNDLNVADAVRFSVATIDDSDVETEVLYANPNGNNENTYLKDTIDITADTVSGSFGILEQTGFFDKADNYTETEMYQGDGTPSTATTKYTDPKAGFIKDVIDPTEGETFNVAVDVWIEGTDADCVDDLTDDDYFGLFDLYLEFYTLNLASMETTSV